MASNEEILKNPNAGFKEKMDQLNKNKGASAGAEGGAGKVVSDNKQKTLQFKKDGKAFREANAELYANEGSDSDKVKFICTLGDPKVKQPRVENGQTSKDESSSHPVVGYKFEILADMKVPFAPISENYKSLLDVDPPIWKDVKAGTTVSLNLVETGIFISQPKFGGTFSGGAVDKGGKGTVYITSKAASKRQEQLPVLNKREEGSIKTGMELIADYNDATKAWVVKPEYAETFQNMYNKKKIARTSKSDAGAVETSKTIAAAFYDFYKNKKGYDVE